MDPRNRSDVEAVSVLHEKFLGDSPVARLGPAFLRDVYYSKLLADGLYDCLVCRSRKDGRVVAFISYTDKPMDFMARGLKLHFFRVAWSVYRSVLAKPQRLRDVLFVLRLMSVRSTSSDDRVLQGGAAEALSMAVLPEFQNSVPEGGKTRIAVRLIELMAADMRERNVSDIAFYVDPANRAANLLYSAMGCKFEKIQTAGTVRHRFIYPVSPRLEAAK